MPHLASAACDLSASNIITVANLLSISIFMQFPYYSTNFWTCRPNFRRSISRHSVSLFRERSIRYIKLHRVQLLEGRRGLWADVGVSFRSNSKQQQVRWTGRSSAWVPSYQWLCCNSQCYTSIPTHTHTHPVTDNARVCCSYTPAESIAVSVKQRSGVCLSVCPKVAP